MTTTYAHWGEVPAHLRSKAQLERLEFPRRLVEGAQPAGWVATQDWRGRDDELALYDLAQTVPTAATPGQLEAAARRSGRVRICSQCGARCERVLARNGQEPAWCRACRHIARLRERQAQLAQERVAVARRVAERINQGLVAVVAELVRPPQAPEAARRPAAVAVRVQAAAAGVGTEEVVVRLGGRRNPHVPPGAVGVAEAGPNLVELLGGRPLAVWDPECAPALDLLASHLRRADLLEGGLGRVWEVATEVKLWRGEINPRTHGLVPAVDPGTAERLLALLERIAATPPPETDATETTVGA